MNDYKIDHLDPLAQGVFKQDDQIYFIPKTLPGESGKFRILKRSKGVNFCEAVTRDSDSPDRIDPACAHFENCPSCHFLHTSYDRELDFKTKNFERLFQRTPDRVIKSPQRLHYRNRVQLHYDSQLNLIGFVQARKKKIIPIPQCQILEPSLQKSFEDLLQNWSETIRKKNLASKGHVELYLKHDEVLTHWNKAYAEGGFTQVNEAANNLLKQEVIQQAGSLSGGLLELFSGAGNLSQSMQYDYRSCLDIETPQGDDFFSIDLFQPQSLEEFLQQNNQQFDSLMLDPPRAGFKDLAVWIEHYQPKKIIYISCNPHTLKRDLATLPEHYQVESCALVDLFPATFHYEAVFYLQRSR